MTRPVATIVTYHYVRDAARSRFSRIKGLRPDDFRGQLDYIQRFYAPIGSDDLLAFVLGDAADVPAVAIYLTFDDGLIDHYETVFPLLVERGMHGAFFPPVRAVMDREVLHVHKIHFILAASRDVDRLVRELLTAVDEAREAFGLESNDSYLERYAVQGRFDAPEVVFIKRMLQTALPEALRTQIAGTLFRRLVTEDERGFADDLYVSESQLREMGAAGMYVGGHGSSHNWLNFVGPERQEEEVAETVRFLERIGTATNHWIMCYPHGGYDDGLIAVLRRHGCAVGLSVDIGLCELGCDDAMTLPRLDTNHLPQDGSAPANSWTLRALGKVDADA